jgi:hypothetical protein
MTGTTNNSQPAASGTFAISGADGRLGVEV